MSVGKVKRQSTTSKVTLAMIAELKFLLGYSEFKADGFIARFRGVEYAIVAIRGTMLIPCPVLHPGIREFYHDEVTIRKGLI
jgi:hypothetical protein